MSEGWDGILFPTKNATYPNGYLSASTIKGWRTCARCLFLDKVVHQTKPVGKNLVIGAAVHKAIEWAGRSLLEEISGAPQDWPYETEYAVLAAEKSFENAADGIDDRVGAEQSTADHTELIPLSGLERSQAKDEAMRLSRWAVPAFTKLYGERTLVAVESPLDPSKNPFPFPLTGRVDAKFIDCQSDTKTAGQKGITGMNDRIQGGLYQLFDPLPVVFDTLIKNEKPYILQYELTMSMAAVEALKEHVTEIAEEIRDGYLAYLEGDWRTVNRCFPIGQGFIGRHDYDHGLPEAHERLRVSFPGVAV